MIRSKGLGISAVAIILVMATAILSAVAQTSDRTAGPTPSQPPVDNQQALYLIRSTLMTLNDANRSGNYTVLRDLAAPSFQRRNTAADLAQVFSDLRAKKIDLFLAATVQPQFNTPTLDQNRRLRLQGFFPTRPLQIRFDLTFEVSDGLWKLYTITVATPPAEPERPGAR